MDPSEVLCRIHDSFSDDGPQPQNIPWASFAPAAVEAEHGGAPGRQPYAPPGYDALQTMKRSLSGGAQAAREACNPFEGIGRSTYLNRDAVKLANLDAICGLTPRLFDPLNTSFPLPGAYTFADVAGGPGGFTQYLQRRYPTAKGVGITLRGPHDFNMEQLDSERFQAYYGPGPSGTGDLLECAAQFQEFVAKETRGVDLLLADGGDEDTAEPLASRLLTCEAYLGVSAVLKGGDFVCKVFDSVERHTAELLYLVATCFDKVALIKPVTSRPACSERYLVCKGRRPDETIDAPADILYEALYQEKQTSLLVPGSLPPAFLNWLAENNRAACEAQTRAVEHVKRYMAGDRDVLYELPQYALHKFSIIWNIPQ